MILHEYPDAPTLHARLAAVLQHTCEAAIATRGRAWLALAGGRTPLPAYRAFAASPLPWTRVAAVPTDERCVPALHEASNHSALAAALAAAEGLRLQALCDTDGDCDRSLATTRALLARHPEPFDAVVVGMGADAHFASLFPLAAGLAGALDPDGPDDAVRVDPVPPPPEAPFPRISLTLARLLRARAVHLVLAGDDKRAVLEAAAAADDVLRYPVAALLHAGAAPLHLHWAG